MTREELAAMLNGREYLNEITTEEEAAAKAAGLVVIFGASDDLCEMRGAIHDEVGGHWYKFRCWWAPTRKYVCELCGNPTGKQEKPR